MEDDKRPFVFVFGSNREGRHGAGSAKTALDRHGAIYGQAEGRQGNSYAIVTKELRDDQPRVTIDEVAAGVERFLDYASDHIDEEFFVVPVGCGLAGFSYGAIAPLFDIHTKNVRLAPKLADALERWRMQHD